MSTAAAFYSAPSWSPDGSKIAFLIASSKGWLSLDEAEIFELRIIPASGGASEFVTQMKSPNAQVSWSADGKRLYYSEFQAPPPNSGERGSTTLVSIRTDGVDKRSHAKIADGVQILPSPDEQWMLVLHYANAYLAALPKNFGEAVTLNLDSPQVPVKQVSTQGALYPRWSADSASFSYAFTNHLYRLNREDALKTAKVADVKPAATEIALSVPRHLAKGKLALRNVRAITMKGDEVIERADILIEDNRIAAVCPLVGAGAMGVEKDLGSIEPDKVADLVVLDKNPLENLQNSESIRLVIKGGEVFEGGTLDRVWPSEKKLGKFYWQE